MIAVVWRQSPAEMWSYDEDAGPEGLAWDPAIADGDKHAKIVLRSFSANIAGGTDEIQVSQIARSLLAW